jgi:putative endonuclease
MSKTPPTPRATAPHLRRGLAAEYIAADFLESQGLTVLARNFRCRAGEIDLLCLDAGILAVVEVRQRAGCEFGGPLASVRPAKQRKLIRAAGYFLLKAARWRGYVIRFDVVAVNGLPEAAHAIDWVKDAFRAR